MNRPSTDLILPSGYTAKIATYWTFEERSAFAEFALGQTKASDLKKDTNIDISHITASEAMQFQMMMVKMGVLGLISPEGNPEDRAEVCNLPSDDVDFIFENGVNMIPVTKKK